MRKTAALLALALVVSLGIAVPTASAALADTKVVIIVGATHGATAGYRADADQAYAEAIKYTSNVVRVYSPYATWANVKAAVAGASIVIYMGHGNGWPSPYTYDPLFKTKDGFGLNAKANQGDYNNQYYGEPYDRDARPRARRDHPPPSPLLCVGQLRAGQPRADAQRRPPACRQLRGRVLQGRCLGGHRRRALRRRALPARPVHDAPDDRPDVAEPVERERPLRQLLLGPDARRDGQPGPDDADERLLPVGRDQHVRDHDRQGRVGRPRQYRPAAREHRRPEQGDGRGTGRAARSEPVGPRSGHARSRPARRSLPAVDPVQPPADGASPADDQDVEYPASAATAPPS